MRFLTYSVAVCLVYAVHMESGSAQSSGSSKVDQDFTRASAITTMPQSRTSVRRSTRPGQALPHTLPGYYVASVARNLGRISALARDDDGTIYTLDATSGRLYGLPDRGGDGRVDGRRIIAQGFDRPSGLVVDQETAFVSDARAVWRVNVKTGQADVLASLANISSDPEPRPLILGDVGLVLGLSEGSSSRAVTINTQTGRAALLKTFTAAPLSAFAAQDASRLWAAAGGAIWPIMAGDIHFPVEASAQIKGLSFPNADDVSPAWPAERAGQFYIAQTEIEMNSSNSGGFNVVALASQFGTPEPHVQVVMDGFYSPQSGQSWGRPGPMVMSPHGLLVGDAYGTLWRMALDTRPPAPPRASIATPLPDAPVQKPSHAPRDMPPMIGSQIERASTLPPASNLKVGSYLKKISEDADQKKKDAESKNK